MRLLLYKDSTCACAGSSPPSPSCGPPSKPATSGAPTSRNSTSAGRYHAKFHDKSRLLRGAPVDEAKIEREPAADPATLPAAKAFIRKRFKGNLVPVF